MAANPGRLVAEIPATVPYPRSPDFRTSEFACLTYCRTVGEQLQAAIGDALVRSQPNQRYFALAYLLLLISS